MENYILHTKINSLHLISLRLFLFNHVLLKLNSATGREEKQTKFNNAENTFVRKPAGAMVDNIFHTPWFYFIWRPPNHYNSWRPPYNYMAASSVLKCIFITVWANVNGFNMAWFVNSRHPS